MIPPRFSRSVLAAAAVLLVATPFAEAGVLRPDIDVQTYRDYAENRGVFQPGATNVTVYKSDGSVAGVIAVVPDFDSVGDGGYLTMINSSFGGSVAHMHDYVTEQTFAQRFNDTGLAYSIFGDTYHEVANLTPSSGFDYMVSRYSKIFIDAAPSTLMTDTTYLTGMTGKQITRVGGGAQAVATGSGTQIDAYPGGDNFGWLTGGFNKVDSVSTGSMTETVGGVSGSYANYTLMINMNQTPDSTLEIGTLGGDSGSPVYAWNTNTNRYEIVAFNQAGGGTGAGYDKTSYLLSAPQWSIAMMNSYNDPTVVDTSGGGVITMSATNANGLGTLTQGATVWNFHGLANGLSSATATDAQLDGGKNLIFSGAGNTLRLTAASVDLGAGSMTFTGGGTYTIDDGGVNTRRLNTAGYIVEAGTTLISKITGSAGDDWRKIGAGTLRIEGSGANYADLSLGEGLVELNRTGGAAVANVLITSGRGTVRMLGDNQISGTVAFGRRGGTLDLYGHNFSRDVVYALDDGAKITNTAANTTSTFTWTGSGTGLEQIFRGGFSDGGSLANGLLNVVIAPTTPSGSVLTLRGVSNNSGGFAINGGEVVLRGYNTPHAGATNGEQPGEAFPDDWTYAGISTGTITVASGAKFTLADHARLDGNVTVASGGTFAITENLFKATAESVEGGPAGTPSATLYGHQSGTVTLSGATSAMIATISGNTDQSVVYSRNITGAGSFTKNGAGTLTLSGTNTFSGSKTINAGALIGGSFAALGDTTTNKWNVNSAGTIAVTGATAAQVKTKITTGSTGTLALAGTNPDAAPDLTGYSGLYLGAIGAQSVGTAGTSTTLTAWNGTGWNLGGGGGTLTMNLKLSGAGALNAGNGYNPGIVVLTNAHNNDTTGGAAFTGAINVNSGVSLRYTDINALGVLSGADRIAVGYGAQLTLGSGANAVTVFNAVTTGSGGVLRITGTDTNTYSFSGQGLNSAALGADGTATFSGAITPGTGGYKFGGGGNLTVTSILSGANALSVDGQGTIGGVTTLTGANTLTGAVTVQGGVFNGATGAHTLVLGSASALSSASVINVNAGGTLDLNAGAVSGGALVLAGGTIQNGTLTGTSYTTSSGTVTAVLAGSGGLTQSGAGTTTLSGANTYTGGTTVSAGTLKAGNNAAFSTGAVTLNGGLLNLGGYSLANAITLSGGTLTGSGTITGVLSGAGTLTYDSAGNTLNINKAGTFTGGTTIKAGTVQFNAPPVATGTTTLAGGTLALGNIVYNNAITVAAGSSGTVLAKSISYVDGAITGAGNLTVANGSGTMYLRGSMSGFTGAVTMNSSSASGIVATSAGSAAAAYTVIGNGAFDANGTYAMGSLSGTGKVEAKANTATTVSIGALGTSTTFSGILQDNGTGALSLTKVGTGTLTLSGANTYTGGTTLAAGTLTVGNGSAFGTGAISVTGDARIINSNGFANNIAIASGATLTVGGGFTAVSGVISGAGNLTVNNSVRFAGNNTFTGDFTVTGGNVTVANDAGFGASTNTITYTGGSISTFQAPGAVSLTRNITLAGIIGIDTNGYALTLSGILSGSGGLTKSYGSALTTLTGANTYTGGTAINVGTVSVSSDANLGAAPASPTAGNLSLNGGTLKTTAAFTLNANRGVALGASGGTFDSTALTSAQTFTLGSVIAGSGPLTLKSNGDTSDTGGGASGLGIDLRGANTFAGDVTVTSGLVSYTSDAAFGAAGNKIILNGGGLLDSGRNLTISHDIVVNAGGGLFRAYSYATATFAGAITGSGALRHTDGGTINLAGNLSGYTGTYNNFGGSTNLTGTGAIGGNWIIASGTLGFNSSGAQSLAGIISGSGALTKSGSGTTTLSGNNTYTGGTTVSSGTLLLGSGTALANTGAVTISGGTLNLGGFSETVGAVSLNGGTIQNGTLTGTSYTTSSGFVSAILSGPGALTKSGAGTLVLTGANTYAGGTTITGGTLQIGDGAVNGTMGGGSYAISSGAALYLDQGASPTNPAWGNITGAGTLILGDASSSFVNYSRPSLGSGFTGTLQVNDRGRITATPSNLGGATKVAINAGAQFLAFDGTTAGTAYTFAQNFSINGLGSESGQSYGALRVSGQKATFTGNVTLTGDSGLFLQNNAGGAMNVTGVISDGGSGYGLSIAARLSTGAITLSGANTYSGVTTTASNTGTLILNNTNALQNSTLNHTAGSLAFASTVTSNAFTLGGLSGTSGVALKNNAATPAAVALSVGNNNTATSYSGVLSASGSLTKVGSGTLTLSGNNTYTGGTVVNGGTLLAGHNSAFGTGAVTVANTGTLKVGLLGAARAIANAVTVSSGGRLAGTASMSGGVTLAAGASYLWEITGAAPSVAGTDFDQIVVTGGNLNIASGVTLKLAALAIDYAGSFWDSNHGFTLATKSGTGTITGSFGTIDTSLAGAYSAEGSWSLLTAGNGDIQALWTASAGMQGMSLQAVPEPSTYGLLGAGALAVVAFVRRRRKVAA